MPWNRYQNPVSQTERWGFFFSRCKKMDPKKVEVEDPPLEGCRKSKASQGEAVVGYREPLATQEMRYHRLSHRIKNMTNSVIFLNITYDRLQKSRPNSSNPVLLLLLVIPCHVFYATIGFV